MTWTTVVAISAAVIAACYLTLLIAITVAIAKTPPPWEPTELTAEDEELVAALTARMKAYGAAAADHHDTTSGDHS